MNTQNLNESTTPPEVHYGMELRGMSEKQPEALRLAGILSNDYDTYYDQHSAPDAAAELCRLHQSEQEGWRYASELEEDRKRLTIENQGLRVARIAYASEFAPDADGDYDTGNIHQNIRALKAECAQYRSQRDELLEALQAFVKYADDVNDDSPELDHARSTIAKATVGAA